MEDYHLLEWDSLFFGYKIASIKSSELTIGKLYKILEELRDQNFKLAYCFVNPKDKTSNNALIKISGLLVDEKITYFNRINEERNNTIASDIIPYNLNYVSEELKSLTLQSGLYSRFKIDPNFRNSEFEKLYFEWIKKSVSRVLANEILIFNENQELKGFVTLAFHNNIGTIGLIAVDANQRGKSIGKKLIDSALFYFKERNITNVEVVTQKANNVACKFYESCGFEAKNIVNIYHLWIT